MKDNVVIPHDRVHHKVLKERAKKSCGLGQRSRLEFLRGNPHPVVGLRNTCTNTIQVNSNRQMLLRLSY